MDPISNVDQLVLILRERIREKSKSSRSKAKNFTQNKETYWVDNIKALALIDDVDDRQIARALVQNILSDQFGRHLVNDPKFQQMIERVVDAIESDETGAALIKRFIVDLRTGDQF